MHRINRAQENMLAGFFGEVQTYQSRGLQRSQMCWPQSAAFLVRRHAMTVITMTREMGTLGKDVAAGVADRLGIQVIHHELVERHLAERLHTSESAVHRFLEGEASMWERWHIDTRRLSRYTAEEILELAMRGNVVIRGWGGAQLLQDVKHVLRVRVCAPMKNRIGEMKRRLGIDSDDVARREIERNDAAHGRVVQRQLNVDWRDAIGYDIVINTDRVPIDAAVVQLQQLAKCGAYEATEETRAVLMDKLLEARARMVLDDMVSDTAIGSSLMVQVRQGTVTIEGVISQNQRFREAIEGIRSIEGVKDVKNETISLVTGYGP
jgi:cytidylate kinase